MFDTFYNNDFCYVPILIKIYKLYFNYGKNIFTLEKIDFLST